MFNFYKAFVSPAMLISTHQASVPDVAFCPVGVLLNGEGSNGQEEDSSNEHEDRLL